MSASIAVKYIDFLSKLEDVYEKCGLQQPQLTEVQNKREEMLKNFFESCIQNIGEHCANSS